MRSSSAWSSDASRFATAGELHCLLLYDTTTGQPLGPAMEHENTVAHWSFFDADRRLMTVVRHKDCIEVSLWDTATCLRQAEPLSIPTEDDTRMMRAQVSPSATCVAV